MARYMPLVDAMDPGRHYTTDVDGCRSHWVEFGSSTEKPPIVFLHGLNDCHLSWRSVAGRIGRDRRVLVPDLPGHGLSGRPDASYELRWYARAVTRWLEALSLDTVDLVGHSFGGGVSLVMLLECPARIRRLVLVSSGGLGREVAMGFRLAAIPGVVERFGQPFMGPGTKLALKATCDALTPDDIQQLSAMNSQDGSARAFARTVRDVIDWRGQRHSFFTRAAELGPLPSVAVFWGRRDTIIPVSHAQALADSLDGVRLKVFEECGHYPHRERPDAFVRALLDFVDDPTVTPAILRRSGSASSPAGLNRKPGTRSSVVSFFLAHPAARLIRRTLGRRGNVGRADPMIADMRSKPAT